MYSIYDTLPPEVVDKVISYLELPSLKQFNHSCTHSYSKASRIIWKNLSIDLSLLSQNRVSFTRVDHSWIVTNEFDNPFSLQQNYYLPCISVNQDRVNDFVNDMQCGRLDQQLSLVKELTIDVSLGFEQEWMIWLADKLTSVEKVDLYLHADNTSTSCEEIEGIVKRLVNAKEFHVQLTGDIPQGFCDFTKAFNIESIILSLWEEKLTDTSVDPTLIKTGGPDKCPQLESTVKLYEFEGRYWPVNLSASLPRFFARATSLKVLSMPTLCYNSLEHLGEFCWVPKSVRIFQWRNNEFPTGKLPHVTKFITVQCNSSLNNIEFGALRSLRLHSITSFDALRQIISSNPITILDLRLPYWEADSWSMIIRSMSFGVITTLILDTRTNQGDAMPVITDAFLGCNTTINSLAKLYIHCVDPLDDNLLAFAAAARQRFPTLPNLIYRPATFGPSPYGTTHYIQSCFSIPFT